MVGSAVGLSVCVSVGAGIGSGVGEGLGGTGASVGTAAAVTARVDAGDGARSAATCVIRGGGVWTAGSDSTGPHVPPRAMSIRTAGTARSHRACMNREPLVLAEG